MAATGYPKNPKVNGDTNCYRIVLFVCLFFTLCHFCVVLYKHSLEVRNLLCPISASMPMSIWFSVSLHVCQCLPGCGPCGPKKALAGRLAGDLCPQWIKHSLSAPMTGLLVNTHHHHTPPQLPVTLLSSWLQSMDLMQGLDNENGQFSLCWSSRHTQHLCRGRQSFLCWAHVQG